MIAFEIEVTLAATLVTALITILQVMALRRGKLEYNRRISELEKSGLETILPKKCTVMADGKFLAQLVFGIVVFAGFSWWTLCLLNGGFTAWAAPTAVTALIGIVMPFTIWKELKQRNTTMNRLILELESRKKTLPEQGKEQVEELAAEAEITAIETDELLVETEMFADTFPEADLFAETFTETVILAMTETKIEDSPGEIVKQKIPEDSILRRHFLSHLRSQVESGLGPRPSDSILKRHYDTLITSEMEKYVDGQIEPLLVTENVALITPTRKIEPVIETAAGVETDLLIETDLYANTVAEAVVPAMLEAEIEDYPAQIVKQKIPEDSILKRHFLGNLRSQIESGFGARPTDLILGQNYDALVTSEMAKYVDGQIKPLIVTKNVESVELIAPTRKIESIAETVLPIDMELFVESPAQSSVSPMTGTGGNDRSRDERKQKIPEDSILRRHFLSHIRLQIESCFGPRPSDSILKRHYDTLIDSEMNKQLEEMQA